MDDIGTWIRGGIGFLLLAALVFAIARSSREQEAWDELEKQKKVDAKNQKKLASEEEIALAIRALDALPDVDLALNLLRDRYGWRELLETIHIYSLHLQLLRQISWKDQSVVVLPNMQAVKYGRDERRVLRDANAAFPHDVADFGIESFAQEPTVAMLCDLVGTGYVSVLEPITPHSRSSICSLTEDGKALIKLDRRFCRGDNAKAYLRRAPCLDAYKAIADVLYRCERLVKENNYPW